MSFLDRVSECCRFDPNRYRPFKIDASIVGYVDHSLCEALADFNDVFQVNSDSVVLAPTLQGFEQRTVAVDAVLRRLAGRGIITGWRDEPYPVAAHFEAPPFLYMERAAIPSFGVYAYGVHLNGYVVDGNDPRPESMQMWLGRRSLTKQTSPGKLDQIVAGGKSARYSVKETLFKEAEEEAGIPLEMIAQAKPVGAIRYTTEQPEGLRRDVMFLYDLAMPSYFIPTNRDGEIEGFVQWPIEQVIASVRDTDDFKFNCSLVVIDFLIRHGFLESDDPEYVDLVTGLHQP